MTNTRRNTLILSILLILLSASAFYLFNRMSKRANELQKSNKETEKKISVLQAQISNIDSLKMEFEIRTAMLAEQSKVIVESDTPTSTYRYLLQLLTWMNRNLNFDFAMSAKKTKDTTWNEYVISGVNNYRDGWEFTRNIEHQRAVITIEDLSIGSDGIANSDTVSYSMIVRTHFTQGGVKIEDLKHKSIKSDATFFQLFRPRIFDKLPDDTDIDSRLVVLEQCKLIGISENRIFVRNEQGVIKILAVRDKVAYGYLYAIDTKRGRAIFVINKFGIPEEQVLELTK